MMVWNILVCILSIIGLATLCCGIMLAVAFARSNETDEDLDRHRQEDEEQIEYLKRWKETHK